jgi:superfamily II helicase
MDINEILKNNKTIESKIKEINDKIESLELCRDKLKSNLIAPCLSCPYDGVIRCDTCASNYYDGYNIKDYPSFN